MAAYTGTPRTWTAGETVTAALMNSDVRDPLAALSGAWTSYTPTLTGFTPGNGVASGSYMRVGKLVVFRASFVFGTTSAGASAWPALSLPVASASSSKSVSAGFNGYFWDESAGDGFVAVPWLSGTTTVGLYILGTYGEFVTPTSTTPFNSAAAWTTSDAIYLGGTYECS